MNFEFEFISEKVIPDTRMRRGKYVDVVKEWLETDNKTLVFKCKNQTQKKNVCTSVRWFAKKHNLDYTVFPERSSHNVYVVRA